MVRLLSATGLLLLALGAWLTYGAFGEVKTSRRMVDQVFAEDLAATRLLATVRDAETGQRGYLLTGDASYLPPYDAALQRVDADLAYLDRAAAFIPAMAPHVAQIRSLTAIKMEEMARCVALRQSGRGDLAMQIVRIGSGRLLMVALRGEIDTIRSSGKRILAQAQARAEAPSSWIAPFGPLVLAMLLFGGAAFFERGRRQAAAVALARRQQFVRAFGLAPGMLRDPDGRITFWADGMQRLYGYSAEEAVGRSSHELLATCFPATLAEIDAELMARGEWQGELLHRARDGGLVTVLSRWVLYRDPVDGALSVVEIDQDIGQLRRAETNLQLALDTAGLGTWQQNLLGAGETVWDARTAALLGVPAEAPASLQSWANLAVPDDAAALLAVVGRLTDPADPLDAASIEFRIIGPDGRVRWLQATGRALFRRDAAAASGRAALRLTGTVRDISESRRAALEIEQSATLLRNIIEAAPGVIYAKDRQGRMLVANAAALALIGKPWSEVAGRSETSFREDMAQARVIEENDRRIMERATSETIEELVGGQNGHARVWLSTKAPMRDAARLVVGLVGISVEITERKQQQQALERSNADLTRAKLRAEQATLAKSRFLAGMSHELRTPLNGILGYAELLALEGGLSEQQAARVDAMRGAGQHLLQMINKVLDLSSIEAGQVKLQPEAADPRDIARECLNLVRPGAEGRGLALRLAVADAVPAAIVVDPTRLRQVLLNLLGNAVKFTSQGFVELRLQMPALEAGAARLIFEVADSGRGVPPHRRSELFQDFERLGADPDGTIEGAGLGLAISARFVALMGGALRHEDRPGGGSIFGFDLPVGGTGPARANATGEATAPAAPAGRALRILVVDDIAMNRDITGNFLGAAGHLVTCAEGGMEAVAAVAQSDFDLVLMDLRMPEMDGLEATRRIRAMAGPRSQVPILALTAEAFAEQIQEALRAGMVGHLSKPFTQAELLGVVASALSAERGATPQAPSVKPVSEASPPVLDPAVFAQTAGFLAPGSLIQHLQGIRATVNAVLEAFRAGPSQQAGMAVVDQVHALAGTAGMLGFVRLTECARRYEHAISVASPDSQAAGEDLRAALEASLPEVDLRIVAGHRRTGIADEAAAEYYADAQEP
jgi:PAS domain S-box-containing protein